MVATTARYCPQQNLPKCRTADQRRRQDPRQRIGEPVLGVRHTDTQPWFAQGYYVKRIAREATPDNAIHRLNVSDQFLPSE